MSGYDFHPEVANDVANIAEYTARNTSLDAAARILDEILEAMALLGESPGIGRRREDLTTRPVRFWAVYDYLIAYVPDEHPSSRAPRANARGSRQITNPSLTQTRR